MPIAEVAQYLQYRLLTVGRINQLFTADAVESLHRHSGGICRNLNKLAFLTLMEGAKLRAANIDAEIVSRVTK